MPEPVETYAWGGDWDADDSWVREDCERLGYNFALVKRTRYGLLARWVTYEVIDDD